jgi:ABC-type lipoprotein release transport system permease subunit
MIAMLNIAFKNAIHYRRESLLIGIMIAFGVVVLSLAQSCERGMIEQMTGRIINVDTGHLLIQKSDLLSGNRNEIIGHKVNWEQACIDLDSPIVHLLNQQKEIDRICGRILFSGMFYAFAKSSRAFKIYGLDAAKEKISSELTIARGYFLKAQDTNSIVLHQDVANSLELEIGDNLTLMCITRAGGINAIDLTLCGTFDNCAPWQVINSYIPLKTAQALLDVGNQAMELIIFLKNPLQLNDISHTLDIQLNRIERIKVYPWPEAGEFYLNQIQGTKSMMLMIYLLLITSILGIIMIYMVMKVQRRIREIGILKAVGTSPDQLLTIFLGEIAIISLCWILIGLIISFLMVLWLSKVGISSSGAFSFLIGGKHLFPIWPWAQVSVIALFIFLSSCLAGLFPIRRAIKTEVTCAMRTII